MAYYTELILVLPVLKMKRIDGTKWGVHLNATVEYLLSHTNRKLLEEQRLAAIEQGYNAEWEPSAFGPSVIRVWTDQETVST